MFVEVKAPLGLRYMLYVFDVKSFMSTQKTFLLVSYCL